MLQAFHVGIAYKVFDHHKHLAISAFLDKRGDAPASLLGVNDEIRLIDKLVEVRGAFFQRCSKDLPREARLLLDFLH